MFIPDNVGGKLAFPEAVILRRHVGELAVPMSMPVTAINKNGGIEFWQPQVRSTRQSVVVQSVSKTSSVKIAAYDLLRFGVLRPDQTHDLAALFRCEDVGHRTSWSARSVVSTLVSSHRLSKLQFPTAKALPTI